MVNSAAVNTNIAVISTETMVANPSMARLFRQMFYLPWRTRFYFNADARQQIKSAVAAVEVGTTGEVQVVIEGSLPLSVAYHHNTAMRALQLFGELGVWDTEHNSGILLYINIGERQVEIVADRGIHATVDSAKWQEICQYVVQQFALKKYDIGVIDALHQIGQVLKEFHHTTDIDVGNELSNDVIIK